MPAKPRTKKKGDVTVAVTVGDVVLGGCGESIARDVILEPGAITRSSAKVKVV